MASGLIPQETIEEIKARTDIVTVVEQYVVLSKKSSKNYFGLCPFHSEDTASFSVSPGKQIYYCFGCHKGGDVIHFVMDVENLSYPQAIRLLAERAGIHIEQNHDPEYEKKRDHKQRLEELNTEAARYYYRNLMSDFGKQARAYMHKRGITERTLKQFGLGYAGENWDGLLRHLKLKGYQDAEIEESGLFRISSRGSMIDLFRERLIFPIISGVGSGKIVAFGGRVLDKSMPKYINSPETPIYTKGRHLYGLNLAKKSRDGRILLVEGYMDCISVYQGGIDNVCAVLGTALTEQQARLLRQQTDHVILSLDADRAGQQATLRAIDILEKEGLKITVLRIPEGKDPDDFIQEHGGERFKALMDSSIPVPDYKLEIAKQVANEGQGLDIAVLQDEVCKVLESIDNNILFEVYLTKAASILGIQVDAVRAELARRERTRQGRERNQTSSYPQAGRAAHEARQDRQAAEDEMRSIYLHRDEAYLLILLASHPDVYENLPVKPQMSHFLAANPVEDPVGQQWIERIFQLIADKKLTITGLLSESIGLSLQSKALPDVLAETIMKLPEQQTLDQLILEAERYEKAVHVDHLTRQRTHLLTQMGKPGLSPAEKQELRRRYTEVEARLVSLRH